MKLKKRKKCKVCGKIKPIREFAKHRQTKDGLTNRCKGCCSYVGRKERDPLLRELGNLARNEKPPRKIIPWSYNPKRKRGETPSKYKVRIVIEFFEKELKHSRDEWAGKSFLLDDWQKDLIRQLYGTLDKGGLRQYREVYCSMAKLGGKTQFAAGLALCHLFHDGKGTEIYCASGDRAQAGLVFDAAVGMLVQNKKMADAVKVSESQKFILEPMKRSFIKVLSHESKTKHGYHPSICIMDEIHSWPSRKLYDVLHKGLIGKESLNFIITTSGDDIKSFGHDIYEYFKRIKAGEQKDSRSLPIIYESDPADDIFSEETWRKANPSLGTHRPLSEVQKAAERTKFFPDEERVFRWFALNQWVEKHVKDFINMLKWDACPSEEPEDLESRRCWMGIDLSIRDDITAVVLVFKPAEDGIFVCRPVMFTPESSVKRRTAQGIPYQRWADNEDLFLTDGDMIDQQTILKYIVNLSTAFKVQEFIFDKWQASYLEGELQGRGIRPENLIEFSQGFGGFNEVMVQFLQLLNDGKINHGGQPVLRWMAGNLVADQNWQGYLRPNKGASKDKIDAMTALLMALDRAIRCSK